MKSYRMGWIAFSILLLLAGCQHQPEEIGLTAVSAVIRSSRLKIRKIRNSQNKTRKSSPLSSMKW